MNEIIDDIKKKLGCLPTNVHTPTVLNGNDEIKASSNRFRFTVMRIEIL